MVGMARIELATSTMSMQGSAQTHHWLLRLIKDNPTMTNELQGAMWRRVVNIPCFVRATAKCFPSVQWDISVRCSVV